MKVVAVKRSDQSSSLPRARSKAVAEAVRREVGGSGTPSVVGETVRYEDANYPDSGRITKSNALIEANYRLTLMETRVILLCISRIDSRHPLDAQRVFRVQASEFQATFGVGREKAYQHLKEVSDRLFERKVELRDPTTGTIGKKIRWVSCCTYLEGQGAVELHFAPEILPYLSEIRAHFTSYSIDAIAGFSSTFAMRLYELLEQYRRLGKRVASVDELRRWLDCEDTFDRFTDFERWAIKVGVEQINEHSDLRVTYRKIKRGRVVATIEFGVSRVEPTVLHQKKVPTPKTVEPVRESPDESERAWRAQMKRYGWDPDKNQPLARGSLDQ